MLPFHASAFVGQAFFFFASPANEEALFILMRSYEALGQTKLKEDTERIIQATYPNSPWYNGGPKQKAKPWWKVW